MARSLCEVNNLFRQNFGIGFNYSFDYFSDNPSGLDQYILRKFDRKLSESQNSDSVSLKEIIQVLKDGVLNERDIYHRMTCNLVLSHFFHCCQSKNAWSAISIGVTDHKNITYNRSGKELTRSYSSLIREQFPVAINCFGNKVLSNSFLYIFGRFFNAVPVNYASVMSSDPFDHRKYLHFDSFNEIRISDAVQQYCEERNKGNIFPFSVINSDEGLS